MHTPKATEMTFYTGKIHQLVTNFVSTIFCNACCNHTNFFAKWTWTFFFHILRHLEYVASSTVQHLYNSNSTHFMLSRNQKGIRKEKYRGWFLNIPFLVKGTWQWGGFSGVFAEISSSWVPYTTFRAVPIFASNSRRYSYSKNVSPLSPIRGVADSPHHWYAESPTPRITDTESRLYILKENSLYRWYGESSTPRTSDTVSRRLPLSLSRRVDDSVYRWYGESLFEKKLVKLRFSVL